MADRSVAVQESLTPSVLIDNELATNDQNQTVVRQKIGSPEMEKYLADIAYNLEVLSASAPAKDPTTAGSRVVVQGTVPTTISSGTVTTVSTVTAVTAVTVVGTVNSATNLVNFGGWAAQVEQLGFGGTAAALLISRTVS